MMASRRQIVDAIVAVAKRLGRAPTQVEFTARTRISRHQVLEFFPAWNDAVRAAGLPPHRIRLLAADCELLKDWGQAVRRRQSLVSQRAYATIGNHDPRTLGTRFGGWAAVPEMFWRFAKGKPEWADVVALLPALPGGDENGRKEFAPPSEQVTYGNPLDFRKMRHEPVNEQGVVLLFGMLAEELGYVVEAVRNHFPDCEAKRRISAQRWQRVLIEFEFESKNFRGHGHPLTGCDVIVCWRHNWPDCPAHIEIVELSSVINSPVCASR